MTNGSLRDYSVASTLYIIDLEQQLSTCNADKFALREWYARMRAVHND
jgi:hypothetical protein